MPARFLSDVTIANAATESAIVDLRSADFQYLTDLLFVSPSTLPETVTVHVARSPAGTFQAFQIDGTDVTLAAAKARTVPLTAIGALKLVAGVGVAAERVFQVAGGQAVPT